MYIQIGFITIGQAPRTDVMEEIVSLLHRDIKIFEKGALDKFAREELQENFPIADSTTEEVPKAKQDKDGVKLISRLRDGSQVFLTEAIVHPLLQQAILDSEAQGSEANVLLCTGDIQNIIHHKLLISPRSLVHDYLQKQEITKPIALVIPDLDQVKNSLLSEVIPHDQLVCIEASPYLNQEEIVKKCQVAASQHHLGLFYFDCLGYTLAIKQQVEESCQVSCLSPRTVIVNYLNKTFRMG